MFKGIKRILLSAVMVASLVVPNVGVALADVTPTVEMKGTNKVGGTLEAMVTGTDGTETYSWEYDNGFGGESISGANETTYVITEDLLSKIVWCRIYYNGSSYRSNGMRIIADETQDLTPQIIGTLKVGETLTAVLDGASGCEWEYDYYGDGLRWEFITGGLTYTVTENMQGKNMRCRVFYNSKQYISDEIHIDGTVPVTIKGTPNIGKSLTAEFSVGDGLEVYDWRTETDSVQSGASNTYTISSPVKTGNKIVCEVKKNGQTYVSNYLKVEESVPTVTITGIAKVGETLTAEFSGANGNGMESYSWMYDPGYPSGDSYIGHGKTYVITEDMDGKKIMCKASNYGESYYYSDWVRVEAGGEEEKPSCTITGTPKMGEKLAIEFTGGDGTETYQWEGRDLESGFMILSGETSSTYIIGSPLEAGYMIGGAVIFKGKYYYTDLLTVEASSSGGGSAGDKNENSNEDVEYATASEPTQKDVMVKASQGSSFTVNIPKKITLDGLNGAAEYEVTVQGDITGEEIISVIPVKSFEMISAGKEELMATVTQVKEKFSVDLDTLDGLVDGITTTGNITVDNLTAGKWEGVFTFNIEVN